MALDLNRYRNYLGKIPALGNYLSEALEDIQTAVNQGFSTLGASPNTTLDPPGTIQGLTVKTDGNGNVHAVINDNNPITKNLHYFVEHDTDPAFSQPHVYHLGASRTLGPMPLPNFDDDGNPQQFYFRAYSQYPGSKPGAVINFGGTAPTAVTPGGTAKLTLLSSTGSGTAQNTGEEGGAGFGRNQIRPQITVKRQS